MTRVACGGGCFLNDVLSRRLRAELAKRGIEMLEAEALPPNDGGLSLGQCWVAQRTRRT
jgi:hydrogenase maturation protein HypF